MLGPLFGPDREHAFWKHFDWKRAIAAGMDAVGRPCSGDHEHGAVDTCMYRPVTHLVAPAKQAVKWGERHTVDGRMAGMDGVRVPGTVTPASASPDRLGIATTGLLLLVIAGHALLERLGRRGGDAR